MPLIRSMCDAYGAESLLPSQNLGGFDTQPVAIQSICGRPAEHRFRFQCEHGHLGRIVPLCEQHYREFSGDPGAQASVAWNLRRDIRFCPRCNTTSDHRCAVRLVTVS